MRPIIQIGNRQRKASGALQEHMETVTSLLAEILQGVRMVKPISWKPQKRPEVRAHLTAYMNALLIFWPGGPVLTQSLRCWVDLLLPVLLVWRLGRCQMASCRSAMLLASLRSFIVGSACAGNWHIECDHPRRPCCHSASVCLLDQRAHIIDPPQPARLQILRGAVL